LLTENTAPCGSARTAFLKPGVSWGAVITLPPSCCALAAAASASPIQKLTLQYDRGCSELFEEGRITYHPVFPGRTGPAARRIEDQADVRDVIELMRLNYKRITSGRGVPEEAQRGA
jgi:Luciferase